MITKQKAILYIRVSTDEQAEKGYSQKHQEERLVRYCELQNIEVVSIYKEDHSAKNFDRPEFQKLLIYLRKCKHTIDLLLFTKWDRFSRNAGDAYGMINQLQKVGVDPQAIEQPLDLEIPENKIMLAFYLAAPEVENDRRALNTLVGMRRAKKEGRWVSTAPKGYKNVRNESNKPVIEPSDDAPLIRMAFDELSKGILDIETVRKILYKKGLVLSRSAFWVMVRNPIYCGKIFVPAWKDEEARFAKGMHEPIITESLFYEVQDILNGRKRNTPVKNTRREELPLRGFLACKRCGGPLTGSASHGNGGKYYYYHCQPNTGCKERFKAEVANDAFVDELKKISSKPEVLDLYYMVLGEMFQVGGADISKQQKEIQLEIERLRLRIQNAQNFAMDGEIDMKEYRAIKTQFEPVIEELQLKKIGLISGDQDFGNYIVGGGGILKNIAHHYQVANLPIKQQLIGAIFPEKLIFDSKNYRTMTLNPVFSLITTTSKGSEDIQKKKGQIYSDLSCLVAPPRIELGSKV